MTRRRNVGKEFVYGLFRLPARSPEHLLSKLVSPASPAAEQKSRHICHLLDRLHLHILSEGLFMANDRAAP